MKSATRQSSKEYFFLFGFVRRCMTWSMKRGYSTNKQKHYLRDYGDYIGLSF